jgi:predicted ribosome quality control (RQC) complex YloA/Tae2 family protein
MQDSNFESEKNALSKMLNVRLKSALKRKARCEKQVQDCLNWEAVQHEALLLQANFYLLKKGMRSIEVSDWENENQPRRIILDPFLPPGDEVKKRFQTSRKLQKGIPHWQNQVNESQKDLDAIQLKISEFESIQTKEELENFQKAIHLKKPSEKAQTAAIKALPYREFHTQAGLQIWVGKSARNNDLMTFRLARGSDYWMHVRDYPGSHIVVRVRNREEPDQESIQDAIQLALHYSKAKELGEAEVCITQCKYLTKVSGRPGAVQISKQRSVRAIYDKERIHRLTRKN